MKQLFFILFVMSGSIHGWTQSNDLLGTWYLDYMLLGDVQIHTMGGANPYIVFDGPTALFQITGNGGCNNFEGTLDYDSNNETYVINTFSASSNSCTSPIDQVENIFFDFFMSIGQEYSYTVFVDGTGEEVLNIQFFPIGDTVKFRRTPPLAVENFQAAKLELAPNPVNDVLQISSEMSQIETLSIYDISGSNVLNSKEIAGALDVSALKSGMYFLEIRSNNGRAIKKFMKECP